MQIVTTSSLKSRRIAVPNASAAIQDYYEAQGWTDGLPVVPATEDLVWEMLGTFGRDPAQSLGVILPRNAPVTLEKIAHCTASVVQGSSHSRDGNLVVAVGCGARLYAEVRQTHYGCCHSLSNDELLQGGRRGRLHAWGVPARAKKWLCISYTRVPSPPRQAPAVSAAALTGCSWITQRGIYRIV